MSSATLEDVVHPGPGHVAILAVVFLVTAVFGPTTTRSCSASRSSTTSPASSGGATPVSSPRPAVLDGRDVSDECTVPGQWASLDDLPDQRDADVGVDGVTG